MSNISKIKIGDTTYDLSCGEVVTITSASGTLTQEVYNKIISSPFNKIKYNNRIYILQEENNTSYVYTNNYLTTGNRITITKSTRGISHGSLSQSTAYNYIGAKDTNTNGITENGNTYLKLYEGGEKRSQFNIKGTGATTVTSNSNGDIIINSTDTNTDTKVTSVDNHYTPTANSTSEIRKDASSTTEAKWGTTSLVTGVNIQRDEKGHVTGMTLDSIKMPAKPETGGGGSGTDKGFDNLSALTIAASQYASPQSAAGPFYFKGSGTASWKDSSAATSIPEVAIQLGCDPGAGISFRAKGEGAGTSCEIGLTDLAVLDLGTFSSFPVSNQTLTDEQAELIEQHKYSFIKFKDTKGWNKSLDLDVYCVPVDNAPSHGGITYKSITTQGNTYTVGISIERTSGNVFAHKTFSITKAATPSGGGSDIPVIRLSGTSGYITQAQWNTLTNADASFIMNGGNLYVLNQNIASTMLLYSLIYYSSHDDKIVTRNQITINSNLYWSLSNKQLPTTAGCILSMQNNDSSQGSTTPYYGRIFIGPGLKLNNGILSLAVSSPATIYVHNIKLTVPVCTSEQIGQDMAESSVLEFAFYSSGGFFSEPIALWSYIVGNNNWTPTINGKLYGSSGEETVTVLTKETIEGTDYLCIQVPGGYEESTKYYVTEEDMIDPTKTTLIDGCREI